SQGTAWNPHTLSGNNAVPNYSSSAASLTLSSTQLSSLSLGTHYAVSWDWLWDATAQCYKGPGLNQCNTGTWRVQSFTITASYAYSQSTYYAYSQSSYYAYSQATYYVYSQAAYTGGNTIPSTFFGMHMNVGPTSYTTPVLSPIVIGAGGKGVGTVWPYVEPSRGTYSWGALDQVATFNKATG